MTLVAAAVCPYPPLLVPEVAAGEPVAVREPAAAAVADLVGHDLDLVVVVGPTDPPRQDGAGLRTRPPDDRPEVLAAAEAAFGGESQAYGSGDSGSFEPYGVDLRVTLGPRICAGQAVLPLSLTVGAWLLRGTGWTGDRQGYAIAPDAPASVAAAVGAELAALDDRVGLLVLGDGSGRRTEKAPGAWDPRAAGFDAAAAAALKAADPDALLALDQDLAADLMAAGRAPWQVLAGAALAAGPDLTHGGRLAYDDAPYGVGYLVAGWEVRP